jgi:hypothetical protein
MAVTYTKKQTVSWQSEVKRLFGHPVRFILTLVLVVIPVLYAVTGGLDWLSNSLYSLANRGKADPRPAVFWAECWQDKTACKEIALLGSMKGKRKMQFSPRPVEPVWYLGSLILAVLGFPAIGNPRLRNIGSLLGQVAGIKNNSDQKESETYNPRQDWLLGVKVGRSWEPDPGYWEFERPLQHPQPYFLTPQMLPVNLLVVAPPGSGKTYSVFEPLMGVTRRLSGSAVFFDSKGDDFDPAYFDYNFDLTSQNSLRLNLYAGATPAQAGERLGEALIPQLSEDKRYFSDVAKDALAALVSAHVATSGKYPTLTQLLLDLTELDRLHHLIERLARRDRSEQSLKLIAGLRRIQNLADTKNDALGTLLTALTPLAGADIEQLLVAEGGLSIEKVLQKPGLTRFSLPVAENPRIAPVIGRLALAQFNFAVLSPKCNRQLYKIAAVDEAHNFVSGYVAKGMAQARSNRGGYVLAFQSLAQIPGKSLQDTILAASGVKMVLAGVSDEDAERFSRTFGEVELDYISHNQTRNRTSGKSSGTNRMRGQEFESFSGGSGTEIRSSQTQTAAHSRSDSRGENVVAQRRLRWLFLGSEIRGLAQYHAIVEASDAQGKRRPAQIVDLSAWRVEALEAQLHKERRAVAVSATGYERLDIIQSTDIDSEFKVENIPIVQEKANVPNAEIEGEL